jgi:hypothetical protein
VFADYRDHSVEVRTARARKIAAAARHEPAHVRDPADESRIRVDANKPFSSPATF